MNWLARRGYMCRQLGLVLVVVPADEAGRAWGWEVSGRVGDVEISIRCAGPVPSLAHAKNAAVAAAGRAVRIAA